MDVITTKTFTINEKVKEYCNKNNEKERNIMKKNKEKK